jgi:hypothetical protein
MRKLIISALLSILSCSLALAAKYTVDIGRFEAVPISIEGNNVTLVNGVFVFTDPCSYVNGLLAGYYTKTATDILLLAKQDANNPDPCFNAWLSTFDNNETDPCYAAGIANYYPKTEADARFATPNDVNATFVKLIKTPITITANTALTDANNGQVFDINNAILTLPQAKINSPWSIKTRVIAGTGTIEPYPGDHINRLTNTALAADACSVATSYAVALWTHYPDGNDVNVTREEANNGTWTP